VSRLHREPKKDCPHVATHVHAQPSGFTVDGNPLCLRPSSCTPDRPTHVLVGSAAALLQQACGGCGHAGENWLCLGCYGVFCSRYVNGHASAHHDQSHHAINFRYARVHLLSELVSAHHPRCVCSSASRICRSGAMNVRATSQPTYGLELPTLVYQLFPLTLLSLVQELWPLFSAVHEAKFGTAPFEERKVIGHSALDGSTSSITKRESTTCANEAIYLLRCWSSQ
jgi:hypothetical protein